jgi:hypothetical protein
MTGRTRFRRSAVFAQGLGVINDAGVESSLITRDRVVEGLPQVAQTVRVRATAAQVDAGFTVLAAIPGRRYRLVDFTLIAIGGNAAGATSVELRGTQTTAVNLASATVATLTQSTIVKPNTTGVTVLANGASLMANDVGTAITINRTGAALTGATNIDVILVYAIE